MSVPSQRINNRWVYAGPSKIHGHGLFARVDVPPGTVFVEYAGPRLPAREGKRLADEGNAYIFRANRREFIDGSVAWNLARYANHACEPNAESISRDGRIELRALRVIPKGDEITYDYGFSFRDDPTPCACGSASCAGVIVAAKRRV